MRTRSLITSIALAVALLIATVFGIAYAMQRADMRAQKERTARYCGQLIEEMHIHGEALRMAGPAESSKERVDSPERTLATVMLAGGYHHCLLDAGVDRAQASKSSLRLSLGLNMAATSVDEARQALDQAIEELRRHGY